MNSWWETPIYSNFLESIKDDIWSGKIVLAFLPKHTPPNFISALQSKLELKDKFYFERINLAECVENLSNPIESFLFSHFGLDTNMDTYIPKSASAIFSEVDSGSNKLFVFENLSASMADLFKRFLVDVGHFLTSLPLINRHKILIILDASNFNNLIFTSESGISKILFQGVFDKLNHTIGVRYYYKFENGVFTSLIENLIASLSCYDVRLIEKLIESDDIIEEFQDCLLNFANEHGWESIKFKRVEDLSDSEIWERWSLGLLEIKSDKPIYHSAYLKIHSKEAELNRRIWLSFTEILLPVIEEIRDNILKSDKFDFNPKFQNNITGEIITDKNDLEIGEICFYISRREIVLKSIPYAEKAKIIEFVNICRSIRNDLSHLKIPETKNIKRFYNEYEEVCKLMEPNVKN